MFAHVLKLRLPVRLAGLAIVAALLTSAASATQVSVPSLAAAAQPHSTAASATTLSPPTPGASAPGTPTSGPALASPGGGPVSRPGAGAATATAGASTVSELAIDAAHLDVASGGGPIDSTGAVGTNRGQYHTIGAQRYISPHTVEGLVTRNDTVLALAVKAMEYSFAHQNADGSFQVVQFAGAPFTLPAYDPVGTDFFMADLGHSLVLFDESGWFLTSSSTSALRQRVEALRPKIALTLRWLSQPAQVGAIEQDARGGTNRLATASSAFLLVGRSSNDRVAMQIGATMAREVIARVTSDGVLPEAGGYDSMYQAVSLHHLSWIALHLSASEASLKAPLDQAINMGVARERRSVAPDGQVSTVGNTRIFCGGEAFRGKAKGGDYRDVVLSFVYDAAIGGNALYLQVGQSVATYYSLHPLAPGACP